jgi:menaquinone-dependent protoporphyrinogen oxidase
MMVLSKESGMPGSVIVGYATHTGSTKEVAEAIGATFVDGGIAADIQPLRNVDDLAGYRMAVLGAPLYMFRWHKDATAFLLRNQKALERLPTAVFALGPFHDEQKEWQAVRAQFDRELAKFPWLAPVATEVFGGKFDPARLRFPFNLVPVMRKMPASDVRDWKAIRAWATSLAAKITPVLV